MATWWYTDQEDRQQATGTRLTAEGSELTFRLAVQPLPIHKRPITMGLIIRAVATPDGIEPVSLGCIRWKEPA